MTNSIINLSPSSPALAPKPTTPLDHRTSINSPEISPPIEKPSVDQTDTTTQTPTTDNPAPSTQSQTVTEPENDFENTLKNQISQSQPENNENAGTETNPGNSEIKETIKQAQTSNEQGPTVAAAVLENIVSKNADNKSPQPPAENALEKVTQVLTKLNNNTQADNTQPTTEETANQQQPASLNTLVENTTPDSTTTQKQLLPEATVQNSSTPAPAKETLTNQTIIAGSQLGIKPDTNATIQSTNQTANNSQTAQTETLTATPATNIEKQTVLQESQPQPIITEKTTDTIVSTTMPGQLKIVTQNNEPAQNNSSNLANNSSNDSGQLSDQLSSDTKPESQTNNINPDGSVVKGFEQAEKVQAAAVNTQKAGSNTTNNNTDSNTDLFQNVAVGQNNQPSPLDQTTPIPPNTKPAAETTKAASEQIQASIANSVNKGENEITINLNPPELGKVFIKFQETNGQITGLIEVSKAETRFDIEQALPEILQNLQNSGVQIKQLNVMQTNDNNQPQQKDQPLANQQQDNWTGKNSQDNTPSQQNKPNWQDSYDWTDNTYKYSQINEQPAYLTEKSINILA